MSRKSYVDVWLERETEHKRKALENASRYFNDNDSLTVNTLEAVYGQESNFGAMQGKRGINGAAGHFMLKKATAERYGLVVSKKNDQRFDIDYASSAAARYAKDLNVMFSKKTVLARNLSTIPIGSKVERKRFVLAAYNGGEGRIARAQYLAKQNGKDSQLWNDVKEFLEKAGAELDEAKQIRQYVEKVLAYEIEFAEKSPADKKLKKKKPKKTSHRCTDGYWRTIDDRPVFICA